MLEVRSVVEWIAVTGADGKGMKAEMSDVE